MRGFFPKICNLNLTPAPLPSPTIRHKRVFKNTYFVEHLRTDAFIYYLWRNSPSTKLERNFYLLHKIKIFSDSSILYQKANHLFWFCDTVIMERLFNPNLDGRWGKFTPCWFSINNPETMNVMTITSCRQIMTPMSFFRFMANLQPSGSRILNVWSIKLTFSR